MKGWSGLLCALLAAASVVRAQHDSVYVRGLTSVDQAFSRLETICENRGSKDVVVVFDHGTFDPDRRRWSPLRDEYPYHVDLDQWIAALGKWEAASRRKIRVATSISKSPWRVRGAWARTLREELPRAGERAAKQREIKPAHKWIATLAKAMRRGSALVLITGDILPEEGRTTRSFAAGRNPRRIYWRDSGELREPADPYWVHEEVEKEIRKRKLVFHVIAPEVRFGGFTPLDEVPQMPWVARPTMGLKGTHRFIAQTMRLRTGSRALNTECPSGYGPWTYARLAAASGGRFLLYPFPKSSAWLDACLFDPDQRSRLAPELVSRKEYLAAFARDPVTAAIVAAVERVRPATPYYSAYKPGVGQLAWFALDSVDPFRLSEDFSRSWRPVEWVRVPFEVSRKRWKTDNPFHDAVPHYEAAAAKLRELSARIEAGKVEAVRPRSPANLRLTIFWFAMASFHLKSRALVLAELQDELGPALRVAKDEQLRDWERSVLRLSDCLEPLPGLPKSEGRGLPYRAQRPIESVLRGFSPDLRPFAERVVAAAKEVRKHEGETPWGWMVYYSELVAHRSWVAEKGRSTVRRRRPGSKTKGTTTPKVDPPPVVNPSAGSTAPTSGG
ncbi:MAG: hypothetical protein ACYTGZ_14985 [Planctomycetota bacterium]|jgi:hypothetical protein